MLAARWIGVHALVVGQAHNATMLGWLKGILVGAVCEDMWIVRVEHGVTGSGSRRHTHTGAGRAGTVTVGVYHSWECAALLSSPRGNIFEGLLLIKAQTAQAVIKCSLMLNIIVDVTKKEWTSNKCNYPQLCESVVFHLGKQVPWMISMDLTFTAEDVLIYVWYVAESKSGGY